MTAQLKDISFIGIRTLETWAGRDDRRRFSIEWCGEGRHYGMREKGGFTGGYRVSVWMMEGKGRRGLIVIAARTLEDAAKEAVATFGGADERSPRFKY